VNTNQNSVKISLVQFSVFNIAKLTVDLETRVLDRYLSNEYVSLGTQ